MLVVIAVIGIITAIAVPVMRGLSQAKTAKLKTNARTAVDLSSSLTTLDVAHVLPDSLGGAEATARLLQQGIRIPNGPLAGTLMSMPKLTEEEISETSTFLETVFDQSGLQLVYDPDGVP
jgi:type II secretory pathway pseudopilin PulG